MSEYIIREEQMKELADIVREKFGLDNAKYDDAALALITGDKGGIALTSLPEGITSIGEYTFNECSNLALTSLPAGITSIGNYAFGNCKSLTSLTFEGTPTSIDEWAFYMCTNLTTINVPWAEGAVAGAPWGATNATINYNYGG